MSFNWNECARARALPIRNSERHSEMMRLEYSSWNVNLSKCVTSRQIPHHLHECSRTSLHDIRSRSIYLLLGMLAKVRNFISNSWRYCRAEKQVGLLFIPLFHLKAMISMREDSSVSAEPVVSWCNGVNFKCPGSQESSRCGLEENLRNFIFLGAQDAFG